MKLDSEKHDKETDQNSIALIIFSIYNQVCEFIEMIKECYHITVFLNKLCTFDIN